MFRSHQERDERYGLYQGQRVSYQVTSSAKGPAAVQVHASSRLTVPYLRYMLIGLGVALLLFVAGSLLLSPTTCWVGWRYGR